MADTVCIHCQDRHPAQTAFCPKTGKAVVAQSTPPTATAALPAGQATGPSEMPVLEDASEKGVLDLLQQALQLYRAHARLLITVAAVVFVPGALAHACARAAILAPTVAVTAALDPARHLPTDAPFVTTSMVAGFSMVLLGLLAAAVTGLFLHGIIIPLAQGALALAAADRIAGGTAGWREIWAWFFRRLGRVLSAIIPAALLTGVGFFFLIVPGLILGFFFAFVPTVALFEGLGGTAALRRSYQLVRSDWLRMLLMLIAFAIVSTVAQFVAGLFPVGLFLTRFLQDALMLLAMPIPVLGTVLLYFDVRRKYDGVGFGDQRLAAEMETIRQA